MGCNKLQNKSQTLSKAQHNKIKQQFDKISFKQIYVPIIIVLLSVFVIGIFIGYCSVGNTNHQTLGHDPRFI